MKEIRLLVCRAKVLNCGINWSVYTCFYTANSESNYTAYIYGLRRLVESAFSAIKKDEPDKVILIWDPPISRFVSYIDGHFGRPLVPVSAVELISLTEWQKRCFKKALEKMIFRAKMDPGILT